MKNLQPSRSTNAKSKLLVLVPRLLIVIAVILWLDLFGGFHR